MSARGDHDLTDEPAETAPDGMAVRLLAGGDRASMAHFELPPATTGRAVRHRTVEELWFVVDGAATLWRDGRAGAGQTELSPGVSVLIPPGTAFQVRAGAAGVAVVATTIPAWPGDDEAELVQGRWSPSVDPS